MGPCLPAYVYLCLQARARTGVACTGVERTGRQPCMHSLSGQSAACLQEASLQARVRPWQHYQFLLGIASRTQEHQTWRQLWLQQAPQDGSGGGSPGRGVVLQREHRFSFITTLLIQRISPNGGQPKLTGIQAQDEYERQGASSGRYRGAGSGEDVINGEFDPPGRLGCDQTGNLREAGTCHDMAQAGHALPVSSRPTPDFAPILHPSQEHGFCESRAAGLWPLAAASYRREPLSLSKATALPRFLAQSS